MTGEEAITSLLRERGSDSTVCPSEAARLMSGVADDWRAQMPAVHEAVDKLLARKEIVLTWKGEPMPSRKGAYRIGRADGCCA